MQLILLKMTVSIFWIEKSALQQSLYYNRSFSQFRTHFDDRPKILTYRQISSNIFCLQTFLWKWKSVKHRVTVPSLRRYKLFKKGNADLSSTTATHCDGARLLSSVLIIAQNDTRNIEYLFNWLQLSLEIYFLCKVLFLSL